jgi:hypothetical protein
MSVTIQCAAGRRGAGSIDCLVCGVPIHQRDQPGKPDPSRPWFDGHGETGDVDLSTLVGHPHEPAKEIGPKLGPFEYVDITYDTVRVDEGRVLANWDAARGDWLLTELAGDAEGEAYSDLTLWATDDLAART